MVIDGKKIAAEIITELKKLPRPAKFLAAILVGERADSLSFLKQKEKVAGELKIEFKLYKFPESMNEAEFIPNISLIANDVECGGVIIQLPLPERFNREKILNILPPEKDPDVLNGIGSGLVLPPAVGVIEEIQKTLDFKLETAKVAVIGLGRLVGQPVAGWLKSKTEELYLLDRGSDFSVLKNCDLIISGAGRANLFGARDLKKGAVVIDFGYSRENGKSSGDFNPEGAEGVDYTPTPGGTGPILVAKLLENFYELNK